MEERAQLSKARHEAWRVFLRKTASRLSQTALDIQRAYHANAGRANNRLCRIRGHMRLEALTFASRLPPIWRCWSAGIMHDDFLRTLRKKHTAPPTGDRKYLLFARVRIGEWHNGKEDRLISCQFYVVASLSQGTDKGLRALQ